MNVKRSTKPDIKAFVKYTDIENFKHYDRILQDGEMVYISTKIHGSSFRSGWFKSEANSSWQKVLKFFHLLPEWTFAWGSRNVQIQTKLFRKHIGFKSEKQGVNFGDIYTKMVYQYDLKRIIPLGYAIYGEIAGCGVQGGYMYDCKQGEHKLYIYDVYNVEEKRWLHYDEFKAFVADLHSLNNQINVVPEMYVGPYSKDKTESYLTVNPLGNEVNEGVVIKPVVERLSPTIGRVILKVINPEYYLQKDVTDFH
jgi:RNA ligase (TIGR02306 family)